MAISISKCEKLLVIHIIDNKLTCESHVGFICKKATPKLNALARIACSLKFDQRKLFLNAFITFMLFIMHLNFLMLQLTGCFTIEN